MPLIWLMKEFPYTMLFLFMQGVNGFFLMYTIQNAAGEYPYRHYVVAIARNGLIP